MFTSAVTLRLGAAAILFAVAAPAAAYGAERAPADNASTEAGGGVVDAQVAPKAKKEKKEARLICKREGVSGSNLRTKKLCLTSEQWRARQD